MTKLFAALALAAPTLFPGVASATDLEPEAVHVVRLGDFAGVVHYMPKRTGFHVVATLVSDTTPHSLRVVVDMKGGDRLLLSAPQGRGKPALSAVIHREGNSLIVTGPTRETAEIKEASALGALPQ